MNPIPFIYYREQLMKLAREEVEPPKEASVPATVLQSDPPRLTVGLHKTGIGAGTKPGADVLRVIRRLETLAR